MNQRRGKKIFYVRQLPNQCVTIYKTLRSKAIKLTLAPSNSPKKARRKLHFEAGNNNYLTLMFSTSKVPSCRFSLPSKVVKPPLVSNVAS